MKNGLNERELLVLELVFKGMTNVEISEKLGFSKGETKSCLSEIYAKLGVKNRLEAVLKYYL